MALKIINRSYLVQTLRDFKHEVLDEQYVQKEDGMIIMPKHTSGAELRSDGIIDKNMAVLSFDGWDTNTVEKIAPYLAEKEIPFTVFIGFSTANENKMTAERLSALKTIPSYGGEVQFYTSQPADTYKGTTNYKEQYTQLKSAYDNYIAWGFPRPRFCSYAGGRYTDILDNFLHELNIKAGRSTDGSLAINSETDMHYPSYYLGNSNFNTFKTMIRSNADWKIPTLAMTHCLLNGDDITDESYNMSEENMKTMIDDIAALKTSKNVTFMKFSDFWDYLHFPRNAEVGQHCLIWEGDNKQHEYVKTENGWNEVTR